MLVPSRREGEWVDVTCREAGRTIGIRSCGIGDGRVRPAFRDDDRHFTVMRHDAGRRYDDAPRPPAPPA